jgi:hypothetical protein
MMRAISTSRSATNMGDHHSEKGSEEKKGHRIWIFS